MPTIRVNGARYYFEEHGPAHGETVVLSHGLFFDHKMFDPQVEALSKDYRCITFDWRGQGRSQTTRSGYDMDALADDTATLIEALHAAPCHFVGSSMGGFAGLRLAIRRPELLHSLVLTSSPPGPWSFYIASRMFLIGLGVRTVGLGPFTNLVMSKFFGPTFNSDPKREDARRVIRAQYRTVKRVGAFRTIVALVFRDGVEDELYRITTPTLIISGEEDEVAYPPAEAYKTATAIKGCQLVNIPHAGHYPPVEQPEATTQAIAAFLSRVRAPSTLEAVRV